MDVDGVEDQVASAWVDATLQTIHIGTTSDVRIRAYWSQALGPIDPGRFKEEILPKLREIPVEQIMKGTGLSLRYCSLIRRGLCVPHPRHWQRLLKVIERQFPWRQSHDRGY